MGLDLRKRAPEVSIRVIAAGIVLMEHKIAVAADVLPACAPTGVGMLMEVQALQRAHQHGFVLDIRPSIADLAMDMFCLSTERGLFLGRRPGANPQVVQNIAALHSTLTTRFHV